MQKINFWVKGEDGQPRQRRGGNRPPGKTLNDCVRQYHQGVLALDEAVGQLIETLKETGQYENTLVVFTSDQGFAWGQHGFRTKLAPYDANIRSPLIVSMPGRVAENQVCETPVGGVDLVPTFFRFAGIDLPWKMHGHDLTPLLENPQAHWSHPVLITLTARCYGSDTDVVPADPKQRDLQGVPWYVLLCQGRHKYVRTLVEGEVEELYNLHDDPEELTNLALRPEFSDKLTGLREATVAELRRTDAGMVDNLPAVRAATE
jgi:arylsulfatase A-like enzyme